MIRKLRYTGATLADLNDAYEWNVHVRQTMGFLVSKSHGSVPVNVNESDSSLFQGRLHEAFAIIELKKIREKEHNIECKYNHNTMQGADQSSDENENLLKVVMPDKSTIPLKQYLKDLQNKA